MDVTEAPFDVVGTVWAVMYGTTVRSLWATAEDAEAEIARCKALFNLSTRWSMIEMRIRRKPIDTPGIV